MIEGIASDAKVEALAAEFVEVARGSLGLELDMTPDSLKAVDAILDQFRGQLAGEGEAAKARAVLWIGAYYGEVVRRQLGGGWVTTPEGDVGLVIEAESGFVLWCFETVAEEVYEGDDKNLWGSYVAALLFVEQLRGA